MHITWLVGPINRLRAWIWQKARARTGGDLARADQLQAELAELVAAYQKVVATETGLADEGAFQRLDRSKLRQELALLGSTVAATDDLRAAIGKCEEVIDLSRVARSSAFESLGSAYRTAVSQLRVSINTLRGG